MARTVTYAAPADCTCRVVTRTDIPGFEQWLNLDIDPGCPAHQQLEQPPAPGQRIRVTHMGPDPDPLPVGTTGTIDEVLREPGHRVRTWKVEVDWDIDRHIGLVCPPDLYEVVDEPAH